MGKHCRSPFRLIPAFILRMHFPHPGGRDGKGRTLPVRPGKSTGACPFPRPIRMQKTVSPATDPNPSRGFCPAHLPCQRTCGTLSEYLPEKARRIRFCRILAMDIGISTMVPPDEAPGTAVSLSSSSVRGQNREMHATPGPVFVFPSFSPLPPAGPLHAPGTSTASRNRPDPHPAHSPEAALIFPPPSGGLRISAGDAQEEDRISPFPISSPQANCPCPACVEKGFDRNPCLCYI